MNKKEIKVGFSAPIHKLDTEEQTYGCRANNPDICRFCYLANTEEKCNAIALIGRQTEILIAREVYKPDIHGRYDGDIEISNSDVKRMLKAYLDYELNNTEKITKWVKASFDLCNQLTHDFSVTHRNVAICVCAVKSLAEVIKTIEDSKCCSTIVSH